MDNGHSVTASANGTPRQAGRAGIDLFLVSVLVLFLELACIRWFPAHVLFLTFFTNTVLLACFLGMSLGCLAARHKRNYVEWTPLLLLFALAAAHWVLFLRQRLEVVFDVGGQQGAPQEIFFGTEYSRLDLAAFVVPIEVVAGFFFVVIALTFVGPGQVLGRAFDRVPNRVRAYTINILGSIVGIVLFAAFSWWQLAPLVWFLGVVLGLAYFLRGNPTPVRVLHGLTLCAVLFLANLGTGLHTAQKDSTLTYLKESFANLFVTAPPEDRPDTSVCYWSPYYRVDFAPAPALAIDVNLIGHQQMDSRAKNLLAYQLPHLLNRDAGGPPFEDVLIIGAGSGNDLSRALQWNAKHVDAVEIDPVIQGLGARHHPDRPYQDPRVRVHLDDGRNFLRATDRQYDLIVFALVDSLVLHSSYSNIRLESFLFTRQSLEDVRRRLKPGGTFVMYNYFRQGWVVTRLIQGVAEAFGKEPLVLTLPSRATVEPDEKLDGFTMLVAGDAAVDRLRAAFERHGPYRLRRDQVPGPDSPNGFGHQAQVRNAADWHQFVPARIVPPDEPLRTATDDWPFLYQRQPMIPALTLRGMAIMGGLALVLLFFFLPRRSAEGAGLGFDGRLFFLGAGFMLIETKAVVHMALLFGSTWIVNSVVFFAVLVMILAANLWVLAVRPQRLWPYYTGLLLALLLQALVPLDYFLGMNRVAQVSASCALVFTPILFAGVIFAVCFGRTAEPGRALGANIAGAMLGGLAENTSMLVGFQYMILVAVGFYLLSLVGRRQPAGKTREVKPLPEPLVTAG